MNRQELVCKVWAFLSTCPHCVYWDPNILHKISEYCCWQQSHDVPSIQCPFFLSQCKLRTLKISEEGLLKVSRFSSNPGAQITCPVLGIQFLPPDQTRIIPDYLTARKIILIDYLVVCNLLTGDKIAGNLAPSNSSSLCFLAVWMSCGILLPLTGQSGYYTQLPV